MLMSRARVCGYRWRKPWDHAYALGIKVKGELILG